MTNRKPFLFNFFYNEKAMSISCYFFTKVQKNSILFFHGNIQGRYCHKPLRLLSPIFILYEIYLDLKNTTFSPNIIDDNKTNRNFKIKFALFIPFFWCGAYIKNIGISHLKCTYAKCISIVAIIHFFIG